MNTRPAATAEPPPPPARVSTPDTALTAAPTSAVTEPERPAFAPRPFAPPSARSASPEDGTWTPWPEQDPDPVLFRASIHPHAASRFIRMDVVAMDLTRTRLRWIVGSKDDQAERLAHAGPPGLVPEALQPATALILNGGFQLRHGRWGITAHGVTLQAQKPEGCVVGLRGPGHGAAVVLGTWSRLEHEGPFEVVRQAPPCLLEQGTIHPDLLLGESRRWGGQSAELRTRRRSALGIDADGRVLYYAVGTETEAVDLARGMQAIGAVTALQLDINWNWTRCLLPRVDDTGRVRVGATLIDGMEYGTHEYFGRPSERDYFFLTREE